MNSRALFRVLKSGHFITVFHNKTIQIKDVNDVISIIDIPHAESIDFNKTMFLIDPADQNFILIFTNTDSSTLALFNKTQKEAVWSIKLPNTEATFFSSLNNGYYVLGRKNSNPSLYHYENTGLTLIEQDLPLGNILHLQGLPNGNRVAVSEEGEISLLNSKFEKQKVAAIPNFSPNAGEFFTSPYGKAYSVSYPKNHLQLSVFNIDDDLKLDKILKYDLSIDKKHFSDRFELVNSQKKYFFYPTIPLANRYLAFIELEPFSIDPLLFPCKTSSLMINYWLSLFDLSNDQFLIKSKLMTSITNLKEYNRWYEPLGLWHSSGLPLPRRDPLLPSDALLISALPDGRLVACHYIDKLSILDKSLRDKHQEFMIFDPAIKECLREDALEAVEKITIPPLATIIADYAGFFAVKREKYKDIPVEDASEKNSCSIS